MHVYENFIPFMRLRVSEAVRAIIVYTVIDSITFPQLFRSVTVNE